MPVATPPPGYITNFISPPSRAYQVYTVYAVFFTLTVLFVATRLYAKLVLLKTWAWDDCTAFAHFVQLILTSIS